MSDLDWLRVEVYVRPHPGEDAIDLVRLVTDALGDRQTSNLSVYRAPSQWTCPTCGTVWPRDPYGDARERERIVGCPECGSYPAGGARG